MPEFNLLEAAGLSQVKRRERASTITEEDKKTAEKLDFSFYDGNRDKGYGGYFYDGRWRRVAQIAKERYGLNSDSKVLIDRCHKGFLVYDLRELIPGIRVYGIHPKPYAINRTMEGFGSWAKKNNGEEKREPIEIELEAREKVMPFLLETSSDDLPFKDKYFDSVISIENACSYRPEGCINVIKEIVRVSKNNGKNSYIQNDSYRNETERNKLIDWTLLCKTFMCFSGWERAYSELGYEGDWGYTIIE